MKKCPNCGADLEDGAAFCTSCGSAVPAEAKIAAYCGNCGQPIEEGHAFCTNCGAPVKPASDGKERTRRAPSHKAVGIAAVAVCAIAVVALAFTLLPSLFTSDADKFVSYHENLLVDPALQAMSAGVDEVEGLKLNTDVTVTLRTGSADYDAILDGTSIVLKADVDGADMIFNAAVNFMGSEVLSGALTLDGDKLGIYLPQAEDTYYTVSLSALGALLPYEAPEKVELPDISGKDAAKMVRQYLALVFETVTPDNLTVEKGAQTGYVALPGSYKATVYTFTPTAEDVSRLMERIADRMEKDKDLRELLDYVSKLYPDASSADEMISEMTSGLRENAADIGQEAADAGFSWSLAVDGGSVRSVTMTADGEVLGLELSGSKKEGYDLALYGTSYGTTETILRGSWSGKGDKLTGSITLLPEESDMLGVEFDCDGGKLSPLGLPCGTMRFTSSEGDVTVNVTRGDGGTDHVIVLTGDPLELDTDTTEIHIFASDKGSAKKPDAEEVDVSDYSLEELEDLFDRLGQNLMGVSLNGLF